MGERGDRGIDKESDGDATGRDSKAEEGKNNKWLWESVQRVRFPLGRPSSLFCFITSGLCGGFALATDLEKPPSPADQSWGELQG